MSPYPVSNSSGTTCTRSWCGRAPFSRSAASARTRGCTIALSCSRAASSEKTRSASAARSSSPLRKTCGHFREISKSAGLPGATDLARQLVGVDNERAQLREDRGNRALPRTDTARQANSHRRWLRNTKSAPLAGRALYRVSNGTRARARAPRFGGGFGFDFRSGVERRRGHVADDADLLGLRTSRSLRAERPQRVGSMP